MRILLGLLLSTAAFAALPTINGKNGHGIDNMVKNPSCTKGVANITTSLESGGTFTRNTSSPLDAPADCDFAPGGVAESAEWLTEDLSAEAAYLKGQNCVARFSYTGDGAGHTATVIINSLDIDSVELVDTTSVQTVQMNFPCGDLTNDPSLKITAGVGAGTINVARVFIGKADNVGTVAQAELYGRTEILPNAGCTFLNTTTGSWTDFAADADCNTPTNYGNATTTDKQPELFFAYLPAGNYHIVAQAPTYNVTAGAAVFFRISDGTNSGGASYIRAATNNDGGGNTLSMDVSYDAPQTNVTFRIQVFTNTASSGGVDVSGTSTSKFSMAAYYFPDSTRQVVDANQNAGYWQSFTPTGSLTTNATYTGLYQCNAGNLKVQAKVAFAGTNTQGEMYFNLPSGYTIDTTKLIQADNTYRALGQGLYYDAAPLIYNLRVGYQSTTSVRVSAFGAAATYTDAPTVNTSAGVPVTVGSGDYAIVNFTVPVTTDSPCNWQNAPLLVDSVTYSSTVLAEGAGGKSSIAYGTYSPSTTNDTNVSSSSGGTCTYMRMGNVVTVGCSPTLTCTTGAGTLTRLNISLPVASNFTATEDLTGTFGSTTTTVNENGIVIADTTSDDAELVFYCNSTSAGRGMKLTFQYVVK